MRDFFLKNSWHFKDFYKEFEAFRFRFKDIFRKIEGFFIYLKDFQRLRGFLKTFIVELRLF
jgi:hypothetical protein